MAGFLLSIASGIVTTLVLFVAREVRRTAKTVSESAANVATVTATVAILADHDAENRERIAALWARVFPDPSPWSSNANSRAGHRARVN